MVCSSQRRYTYPATCPPAFRQNALTPRSSDSIVALGATKNCGEPAPFIEEIKPPSPMLTVSIILGAHRYRVTDEPEANVAQVAVFTEQSSARAAFALRNPKGWYDKS